MAAGHAPDLSTADPGAALGPNKADLRPSGKHQHHGGNVRVTYAPAGRPLRASPVRPGREHDTTRARTRGLIDALNRLAVPLDIPALTDLGYENAGDGIRHRLGTVSVSEPARQVQYSKAFRRTSRAQLRKYFCTVFIMKVDGRRSRIGVPGQPNSMVFLVSRHALKAAWSTAADPLTLSLGCSGFALRVTEPCIAPAKRNAVT